MPETPEHIRIYLASPLFSLTERSWNRTFAAALARALPGAEVILPQDFKVRGRYNDQRHWGILFRSCLEAIDSSQAVVAIVDGADADSGTAFEMGYAYRAGIPVVAVRTDFRQNQDRGVNIMLSHAASDLLLRMSFEEDAAGLAGAVAQRLLRLLRKKGESA